MPAKEVLSPITQSLFYFTEDEYIESKATSKKLLIFMRPCDIHAQHHQERIYLGNGGFEDRSPPAWTKGPGCSMSPTPTCRRIVTASS